MSGYQVKVKTVQQRIEYYCDECDSNDIEVPFFCSWNIETQKFISGESTGDDAYCNDCQDRVGTSVRSI